MSIKNNILQNSLIMFFIGFFKVNKLKKYYREDNLPAENEDQYFIYMADGKRLHGGISDRFCGMVSLYNYCLTHDKIFKIFFVHPYPITDYLLPGQYNWLIDSSEISYNINTSKPVYIAIYTNKDKQFQQAEKILNLPLKQIHAYTNMRYFRNEFGELFHKLFKPSPLVSELLKWNLEQIGGSFYSITFRFQQLLGDFQETGFPTIKQQEKREMLIRKCLKAIENIYITYNIERILVTSDSKVFLERAKVYDYVYIIPGEIIHPDFTLNSKKNAYLKSFLDFFMISEAQKVYLVYSDLMYKSSFAKTASWLHNCPYEEVKI